MVQATEEVMEIYQEASKMQDARASAEEAGKAAMQLANLCDELLKVSPCKAACFCGGTSNLRDSPVQPFRISSSRPIYHLGVCFAEGGDA